MHTLLVHAAIGFARVITPRRTATVMQRILTNIAVAHATARWIAMVGGAHQEPSAVAVRSTTNSTEANGATSISAAKRPPTPSAATVTPSNPGGCISPPEADSTKETTNV